MHRSTARAARRVARAVPGPSDALAARSPMHSRRPVTERSVCVSDAGRRPTPGGRHRAVPPAGPPGSPGLRRRGDPPEAGLRARRTAGGAVPVRRTGSPRRRRSPTLGGTCVVRVSEPRRRLRLTARAGPSAAARTAMTSAPEAIGTPSGPWSADARAPEGPLRHGPQRHDADGAGSDRGARACREAESAALDGRSPRSGRRTDPSDGGVDIVHGASAPGQGPKARSVTSTSASAYAVVSGPLRCSHLRKSGA